MSKSDVQPQAYRAIRMWGENLGSYDYYIKAQQEKAVADNAPLDAIYRTDGKMWRTVRDLKPDHPFRIEYEYVVQGVKS